MREWNAEAYHNAQGIEATAVGDGDVFENRRAHVADLLAEQGDVFVSAFERAE